MTDIAKAVANRIKAAEYKAKDISATGGKWVDGDARKEHFGRISLKHAAELAHCIREDYEAQAVFVIQISGARYFTPNSKTHSAFGKL